MHSCSDVFLMLRRLLALLAVAAFLPLGLGAADAAGTIAGTVSNNATGNNLEGARVEIPRWVSGS